MTNAQQQTRIHPFEKAGLGTAPFRCIGYREEVYQACQGAPIQPGTSCDYCAQGIRYVYVIQGADGRSFKVGSSCVEKCASKGERVYTEVQRAARKLKREAKLKRDKARIERLRAHLETDTVQADLSSRPHPNTYRASLGDTELSHALWLLDHAGISGCIKLARALGVK